jgi:hypothetical protein
MVSLRSLITARNSNYAMLHHHKKSKKNNQKLANHIEKTDPSAFYDLLNGPSLAGSFEHYQPEHRNRVYTPSVTLSMFLSQVLSKDCPCQKVVDDLVIKRMAQDLPAISSSTSAYCQARKAISLDLIASLTQSIGTLLDDNVPPQWKLQGRNSRVVDGTTMLMPDTEENQIAFPQPSTQKEGLGFPICRMVAITSLETGALIDAAIGPHAGKQTGETSLLRNIMNSLNKDDLLLGDSLYCTYFIMIELAARGVDFLFEQNGPRRRKVNFGLGRKLGAKDHIIKLEKPKIKPDWMTKETYDSSPGYLSIREFKAGGKVLVTSMLCAKEMPKKVLSNHYKKRWSVEVDIRNIKTTMGMEMLSCKTPDMVVKEVCVYLLAYNIIHLLMMESALINEILPREISFKHCIQLWLAWCQQGTLTDIEQNTAIFILMAQRKVGDRPGRMEPRAIKRRPKAYALLMRPRAECQIDIRACGHPKRKK